MVRRISILLAAALTLDGLLPRAAQAAPDNTLGMAHMAAYISAGGSLLQGSGATDSTRQAAGIYRIDFDRNVTECFPSVTLRGDWVRALAQTSTSDPTAVFVWLVNQDTNSADASFYLTVFCSK